LKALRAFVAKQPAGTPPSTFLFLPIHLSNSPEPRWSHSPGKPESRRSFMLPIRIGSLGHRISVRCFAGATSRRKRTARRMGLYSLVAGGLSTLKAGPGGDLLPGPGTLKSSPDSRLLARKGEAPSKVQVLLSRDGWVPPAAWKHCAGHCSRRTAATFLGRSWRSGGRCQFGGICARVVPSVTHRALPEIGWKRLAQTVGK
jgi:hypothetical protein